MSQSKATNTIKRGRPAFDSVPVKSDRIPRDESKDNCFRCRLPGHHKENCTTPRCDECERFGHVIEDCKYCDRCEKYGHVESTCRLNQCERCNRLGHVEATCRAKICTRCNRLGHDESTCRTPACDECGKIGHSKEGCFRLQRCGKCLRKGHSAEKCDTKPRCEACREDHYPGMCKEFKKVGCSTCGEIIHVSRDCDSPYVWSARRQ